MTARQVQLIHAEALRHMAMAKASKEIPIKCSHLEVVDALCAALQSEKGGRTDGGAEVGHDV